MTELKEIHFYENMQDMPCVNAVFSHGWMEKALDTPINERIDTLHMSFLADMGTYMEDGVRVFIHDSTGTYEIKLGSDNERTSEELKASDNFFRMWKSDAFKEEVKKCPDEDYFKVENPKPCPFCGGTDIGILYVDRDGCTTEDIYAMENIVAYCKCGCHFQLPDAVDIYDDIDAKERITEVWNKRAVE